MKSILASTAKCLTKLAMLLILQSSNCIANTKPAGMVYNNLQHANGTLIHVLTIDPSKFKIVAARAQDAGLGLATVKELAQHFSALAAINGGFFRFNEPNVSSGLPAGVLKIKHQWHGIAYYPRGAIGWDPDSNLIVFDLLQTQSKKIVDNFEVKPLPQLNPKTAAVWEQVPFVVSGGPLLINNSKLVTDFSREKLRADFLYDKHSRTAVGILPDKHWVFVVAERNLLQEGSGLTIAELANYMQSLSCVMALNLDGGTSSSMYLEHEDISNMSYSRPVADVLLVLAR